jgi:3-oxoacyl-[acyl-carrier protein] reductase
MKGDHMSKVAVVTGGTRGLGRDIADALLGDGWRVVRAARTAPVEDRTDADPEHDRFVPVDVRDPESVRALLRKTDEEFGAVDLLVANAGVSRPAPVAELAPAAWTEVIETNLTGVFHCVQAAVPYLKRSPGGRIVTVSSVLGARPVPNAAAYVAAKAAVEAFTKVSALELAASGITVNCVSPGFIDVGMGRELAANDAVWPLLEPKLALGRMGTGAEVARAVAFLAGADGSYVNGHVLEVNGGLRW